ncbi:winged helix-turn-helix domain-containing protein [Pseudoxanthomonas putridarboris]|uniref:Winged helix-turn-helix domain-containing protein n=1 Tax=Pseudoxanthomonas putridarboris TaxID=752605 RepID=A0ABU9IX24_9GAMM
MSLPAPAQLAFDDVVIDFAGRRLLRGGVEQALEPKAFAVLALLAGEPGRVFARDEILDAVWGHRHVTPGVLNRIVTLLRQALDEDAHHPRLLHTLHGVGYRFDLPAACASPATETTLPNPPGASAETSPIQALNRRASDQAPARRPWHTARRLPLLPAVLVVAVVGALWLWPRADPAPPASVSSSTATVGTPTLVVMPLKPIDDGDRTRIIADGLGEELICSLAQIDGLRVIARDSTRLAAAESNDPAQLVQRLGITHALEGNLQQSGQSLRVRLRLVDAHGGGALWTKDFDRDASEVLLLQREIAEAVAASLALKLGLDAVPARSGDAEFLHRYLVARALVNRRDLPPEASTELAESEFRDLVRAHPDDARARAGLALALEVRAQRKPTLAPALRQEALREATLAMQLDPSLPEPYFVLASDACYKSEWERCLELEAKTLKVAPSNTDVVYGNAIILARLGYLDRAESVMRELAARDPISDRPSFLLGRILDTQGRHDEARREFVGLPPDAAYARWFNAVWRRDYAAALRIAERDIGAPDHPDAYASRLAPGYVAASRALADPSLWPQAVAEFEKSEQSTGLTNFARVLTPDAPARAAYLIRELNQIRQRGYSSWDLLLWSKDLAFLRRDPAFQEFLRDNGILAYWRKHGFPAQCRAQGDGAVCE